MCLTFKKDDYVAEDGSVVSLEAERDIPVWKVICHDNFSVIHGFEYEPNKSYNLEYNLKYQNDEDPKVNYAYVFDGFHSYIDLQKAKDWWTDTINATCISKDNLNPRFKLVKFTIPKGSRYFLGIYGDVVSDAIISGDLTRLPVADIL